MSFIDYGRLTVDKIARNAWLFVPLHDIMGEFNLSVIISWTDQGCKA